MPGRAYSAEAACPRTRDGEVDSREYAARSRRRRIPRPSADDRVGVESCASASAGTAYVLDVLRGVSEVQFLDAGVPSFDVLDRGKETGIFT
jgi:hypothetical protein